MFFLDFQLEKCIIMLIKRRRSSYKMQFHSAYFVKLRGRGINAHSQTKTILRKDKKMETSKAKTNVVIGILALTALAMFSISGYAGKLEPSGPPGSTMKTLGEVEPRTPIHALDIPLTINKSGSYYLTEDITFTTMNTNAITIEANDVTIDLNGFKIKGPASGTTGTGILKAAIGGFASATVMNGTVMNFQDGVVLGGLGNRIINVTARNCQGNGIHTGDQAFISQCSAFNNGPAGIIAGDDCVIKNCISHGNSYYMYVIWLGNGIEVDKGCTIMGCTTSYNKAAGIQANENAVIVDCTLNGNEGNGIFTNYSKISNCTITDNTLKGIYTNNGCLIVGNVLEGNEMGVLLASHGSVVRNNHFVGNVTHGLNVVNADNYSAQNTFYNNSTNISGAHKQGSGDMANIIIP